MATPTASPVRADLGYIQDMYRVTTANYRPPDGYKPPFLQAGLPPFTLETVEWMRRDPQVRLGMAIKLAPFSVVKLTLKGDPAVIQFMGNMIHRFWMKAIPKILKAFWFTRSGGEVVYKAQMGRHEFWNYNDVYPSDLAVLCRNNIPVGITIKPRIGVTDPSATSGMGISGDIGTIPNAAAQFVPTRLFFPKAFLYIHGREFNSLQGMSEFESAYEPWLEKNDVQGAKHSRKLWFYKCAFSGGILFHPPGSYIDENNREIPYRDMARSALEQSLNGAVWTFEQKYDVNGASQWQYLEPQFNQGGEKLLDYVRSLDNEIMRGLGIPDDVVQQISGTGSYAGRSIPLMAFFISQRATLANLFTVCDEQVFRPLCRANFGHDNYEAMMEIDIERLMGTMDGKPNAPQANEAAYQNPHANPQNVQDEAGGPQQFSAIPHIGFLASVPTADSFLASIAKVYNGVWDDSVRRIYIAV